MNEFTLATKKEMKLLFQNEQQHIIFLDILLRIVVLISDLTSKPEILLKTEEHSEH